MNTIFTHFFVLSLYTCTFFTSSFAMLNTQEPMSLTYWLDNYESFLTHPDSYATIVQWIAECKRAIIQQSNITQTQFWVHKKVPTDIITSLNTNADASELSSSFVKRIMIESDCTIAFINQRLNDGRNGLRGNMHTLSQALTGLLSEKNISNDSWKLSNNYYFIFLGNVINSNNVADIKNINNLAVLCTIMQLFLHNPNNILIIRGHEESACTWKYGSTHYPEKNLLDELQFYYPDNIYTLKNAFASLMHILPVAYVIERYYKEANDTITITRRTLFCSEDIEENVNLNRLYAYRFLELNTHTQDPCIQNLISLHTQLPKNFANIHAYGSCRRLSTTGDIEQFLSDNDLDKIISNTMY